MSLKRRVKARGASEVRVVVVVMVVLSVAVMLEVMVSFLDVSCLRSLHGHKESYDIARGDGADDFCGLWREDCGG